MIGYINIPAAGNSRWSESSGSPLAKFKVNNTQSKTPEISVWPTRAGSLQNGMAQLWTILHINF